MYCKKCGKQIIEGDKFCSGCGSEIPESGSPEEKLNSGNEVKRRNRFSVTKFEWDLSGYPEFNASKKESEEPNFKWDPIVEDTYQSSKIDDSDLLFSKKEEPTKVANDDIEFNWKADIDAKKTRAMERESFEPQMGASLQRMGDVSAPQADKASEESDSEKESRITMNAQSQFEEITGSGYSLQRQGWASTAERKFDAEQAEIAMAKGIAAAEAEAKSDKGVDRFYTFNKKNEEFQALLDQEYERLKKRIKSENAAEEALANKEKNLEEARANWDNEQIEKPAELENSDETEELMVSEMPLDENASVKPEEQESIQEQKEQYEKELGEQTLSEEVETTDIDEKSDDANDVIEDESQIADAHKGDSDSAPEQNLEASQNEVQECVADSGIISEEADLSESDFVDSEEEKQLGESTDTATEDTTVEDKITNEEGRSSDEDPIVVESSLANEDNVTEDKLIIQEELNENKEPIVDDEVIAEDELPSNEYIAAVEKPSSDSKSELDEEPVAEGEREQKPENIAEDKSEDAVEEVQDKESEGYDKSAEKVASDAKHSDEAIGVVSKNEKREVEAAGLTAPKEINTDAKKDDADSVDDGKKQVRYSDIFNEDDIEEELERSKRRKHKAVLVFIDIIIVILLVFILGMSIVVFLPDSTAAKTIRGWYNSVVGNEATQPTITDSVDPDIDSSPVEIAIMKQDVSDVNIGEIKFDSALIYSDDKDYGIEDFKNATLLEDEELYKDEAGNVIKKSDAVVKSIIAYYSALGDRINYGDESVFNYVDSESSLYGELSAITPMEVDEDLMPNYVIEILQIGEIYESESGYYALIRVSDFQKNLDEKTTASKIVHLIPDDSNNLWIEEVVDVIDAK